MWHKEHNNLIDNFNRAFWQNIPYSEDSIRNLWIKEYTQTSLSEELLSSLKELEEKLNPILSPWCENCNSDWEVVELCQLANKLRLTNERLRNWIDLIQELKRRIEL